jgi:hypothetical protein
MVFMQPESLERGDLEGEMSRACRYEPEAAGRDVQYD